MRFRRPINLDRWGAVASFICAVHCVLTSVALGLLSVTGLGFLGSHVTDYLFVGFAIAFGSLAAFQGFRRHRKLWPAALFVLGLVTVLGSHAIFGHDTEARLVGGYLSAFGGLLLVSFHIANATLQKTCCQQVVCAHKEDQAVPMN